MIHRNEFILGDCDSKGFVRCTGRTDMTTIKPSCQSEIPSNHAGTDIVPNHKNLEIALSIETTRYLSNH
jgi:hypothetical protein